MADYEHAIFISYAWGEENEIIVNQLDEVLQGRGIKIIRDKRDLEYRGSIKTFMERIGGGDCIIVVISDKYLRSPNCMFELVEIAGNKQFENRIFPVVLADANIYNPKGQLQYIKHWETQIKELDESLEGVGRTHLMGIYEQLDLYDRIRDNISKLTAVLSDMNALTPDMHRDSDFDELFTAIEKRMKERPVAPAADIALSAQTQLPDKSEIIEAQYFEPKTIYVAEGEFWMGSQAGDGIPVYETPRHKVDLSAFRIGKYPVTNAEYEEYISQKRLLVPLAMGWDGQRAPKGLEGHPVTGVTWYEARAYCEWLSERTNRKYFLPNEAQWEKACRGGENTIYPWGDEFDPQRCVFGSDSIAQNNYGCFYMVGLVRQWTSTLWGEKRTTPDSEFMYPWKDGRRDDLTANRQIRRVVRGSSMKDPINLYRCSARSGQVPDDRGLPGARYGFRVAMALK